MPSDQTQDFNERLNQWVASQGFWFQMRYSMSAGGAKGVALFHFLRMAFRLGIFLVVLAVGGGVWLLKRTDGAGFREDLEAAIGAGFGAEEQKMEGFKRSRGELEISRFVARGGTDTYFENLEARTVRCRMGVLDGLYGVWEPGMVSVGSLDLDLRAGADDAASAAAIREAVFREFETAKVQAVEVESANLRWGFFERAGRIDGSSLKIQRVDGGWRLNFRGGTFTQNWLRNLEIIDLTVLVKPEGLTFQKAELRDGLATVDFSGLVIEGGERPVVKGLAKVRRLSLANMLPPSAVEFLEGSISGDFQVTGSTNTGEGIGFEGSVVLSGEDSITVRDRVPLLRALSVVDDFNNYPKVVFTEGSFDLKTGGGRLVLNSVDLAAGDLMTLKGRLVARPPTPEEIQRAIAEGQSSGDLAGGGETAYRPEDDPDFTLRKAGEQVYKNRDLDVSDPSMTLFDRVAMLADARELQDRETERRNRETRYEGEFVITLRPDAFQRAGDLRQIHAADPVSGRISVVVPLSGNLYRLTHDQAEDLYIRGKKR
jgi:hypothetical protein